MSAVEVAWTAELAGGLVACGERGFSRLGAPVNAGAASSEDRPPTPVPAPDLSRTEHSWRGLGGQERMRVCVEGLRTQTRRYLQGCGDRQVSAAPM